MTGSRTLHDPHTYHQMKMEKSAPFFRTTRVSTCSHVMMRNGKAVAIAYPVEKTGWKAENSYNNTKRSAEVESWSRSTYKQRGDLHAGMVKKPLTPYHP